MYSSLPTKNLFEKREISWIIHSLREKYGSDLLGDCDHVFSKGVNEGILFPEKLIPRNSASITDVVLGVASFDEGDLKIAMKIWFGWDNFTSMEIDEIFDDMCFNERPCSKFRMRDIISALRMPVDMANIENSYRSLKDKIKRKSSFKSLEYEANVYEYITENIIIPNVCPGFIPLLARRTCSIYTIHKAIVEYTGWFSGRLELLAKIELLMHGTSRIGKPLDINFIVTGSGIMVTLAEFFSDVSSIHPRDMYSIIFQLFYCLYVMDAYKIQHCDLHFGNIFIQTLPSELKMKFNINGKIAYIPTNRIVKIYDFDRAVVDALGPNPVSSSNYMYGTTDNFVKGYDLAQVLCTLGQYKDRMINILLDSFMVGLGDIAKDIAKTINPQIRSDCIELDLTALSIPFLESFDILTPRAIKTDGVSEMRYYLVPLSGITDVNDLSYIKTVFKKVTKNPAEFKHIKSIMIVTKDDALFLCKQHHCMPTHEYNIPPITEFFETSHFDDYISTVPQKPGSSIADIEYTFIRP